MKTDIRQRHRWIAAAGVLVTATAGGTMVASAPAQAATYGKVSAHRGGDYGSENSLKAFKGALAAGIKDIEGDVRFTTDRVGVMHHDNSLKDCGSSRTITGSTWAQVSRLRCRGGARPAKLADVLRAFRASSNKTAVFRVEVKHHSKSAKARRANAKLLVQRLQQQGMTKRSIVQDFNWRTTASTIRATQPGIRVSCLENSVAPDEIGTAKSKGCYDLSYDARKWRPKLNAQIHGKGMQVAVWTVNSKSLFVKMRNKHANVIITNYPKSARRW